MASRVLTAAAAAMLIAAGCGGDDGPSPEETQAVELLIDAQLSIEEQRCVLDGLTDLGLDADDIIAGGLDSTQDGEVLAISVECVDDLASIEAFVDSFIDGAEEAGTTLTRDEARCAIRALDADDADTAIAACLVDTEQPQAEGDDPILDLLVEQCRRGNNQACDELFADAPAGSDSALYAQTCGNRLPEGTGSTCFETLG